MKKGNFTSLVLLSGALVLPAYAEKVQLEQLPSDLQEKIRAQVGSNRVEDIDRETRNGRTIYEVAFKENGQHREIQIEHNAPATAATSTTSSSQVDSRKISYNELPEHVKRVANNYTQGGEVNDVDRQVRNGRTTYEIGYKKDDGAQQELLISEDGQVLRSTTSGIASSGTTVPGGERVRGGDRINWGRGTTAAANVRSMAWNDLPSTVKETSNARLRDGDVKHVHRLIQNGSVTYQLDFLREDGRWQQLLVAEDGRALRDSIVPASAVGRPGSVQSGTGSSEIPSPDYANITAPVALSSAQTLSRSQLPDAVSRAVRGYTSSGNIVSIQRGMWNGREVYDVTYRERDNRLAHVQFDSAGVVVYDPRQSRSSTGNIINNLGRALFDNDNNP